jgi:hypothetical protein
MSRQAFDKMLSLLPDGDRANILAVAATYGLDFNAPEWIPFAVSQHGLLSIQRAIVDLSTALTEGSNFAIAQAMKALTEAKNAELVKLQAATAASQAAVRDAADKARSAIDAHSAIVQADLVQNITSSIKHLADDTFNRHADKINAAQRSLVESVSLAQERIGQIRRVGTIETLAWAFLGSLIGGAMVALVMSWMINHGRVQQPQARINLDGQATGEYIVKSMKGKLSR